MRTRSGEFLTSDSIENGVIQRHREPKKIVVIEKYQPDSRVEREDEILAPESLKSTSDLFQLRILILSVLALIFAFSLASCNCDGNRGENDAVGALFGGWKDKEFVPLILPSRISNQQLTRSGSPGCKFDVTRY
ncbi:unnamed protein product [Rodentolepis nana]|uniref:Uncharacterized protein n=1 Tax=Rodentolepis nana TaxID=102285 RepID=A0A0R3TG26_RODNA|nr:unnamed protein product [Rodentolepis nana]